MDILVSAIIPVYNSEKHLKECIQSLINQTLENIEIIFVDDGSTDNSINILREYEKKDKRIKVIKQKNSGPSSARNRGIKIATGKYLSFIDSDDWIDTKMYEKMYYLAQKNNCDAVISDIMIINGRRKEYVSTIETTLDNYNKIDIKEKILLELLSNSKFNSMANKIYKNDLIKRKFINLDEQIYYAEDWLFNLKFFENAESASYIKEAFYNYRRGHESSSSRYKEDTFEKVGLWIYKKRKDFSKKNGFEVDLAINELFNVIIHCIISEFRRNDINLIQKRKRVKFIINSPETVEAINNIKKNKLDIKSKFLYFLIKNKTLALLFLYTKLGVIKELRVKNK